VAVAVVVVLGVLAWWRPWVAPATLELPAPESVDDVVAPIRSAVPVAQQDSHVPGVAVAVSDGDHVVWSEGFGVPVDEVFEAGSISKTVAAAAILALADQRRLDLDQPVSTYLRTWEPTGFAHAEEITLRRLLSHTAGIDTPGYLGLPADRPLPTTAQSLDGASTGTPVHQSGTVGTYSYSGGGFTIAQQVVEDVTGQPFADVVRHEVLEPLGMSASGYECTQAAAPGPDDAAGHLADGRDAPHYRYAETAAAGLCTTADDLARFAAWLGSDDPRAETMRTAADGTDGGYGLGVERYGDSTVGHPGVNRGFHAQLLVNPSAHLGLVVLTDGDRGGDVVTAVVDAWRDAT
jgi:CubicO group peptidase (beta-lactamase class C family)